MNAVKNIQHDIVRGKRKYPTHHTGRGKWAAGRQCVRKAFLKFLSVRAMVGERTFFRAALRFGESSNGRTADSGSAYRGSNPLSPATPPTLTSYAFSVAPPGKIAHFLIISGFPTRKRDFPAEGFQAHRSHFYQIHSRSYLKYTPPDPPSSSHRLWING